MEGAACCLIRIDPRIYSETVTLVSVRVQTSVPEHVRLFHKTIVLHKQ